MDEQEAKLYRPDILGWSDDILPYYEEIIKNISDKSSILEMGIFRGRSAIFMIEEIAKSNKEITFYGVDILPCPDVLIGQKIIYMSMTSKEAASKFENDSLDFVFIDGDHLYESTFNDIKAWLPKVRKGGIISGHDYNEEEYDGINGGLYNLPCIAHPGVVKAVNECFGANNIRHPTKTVWEFIK